MSQAFRCMLVVLCLSVVSGCSVGKLDDVVLLAHGPTPSKCQKFQMIDGYGVPHRLPEFVIVSAEDTIACDRSDVIGTENKNVFFPALELHPGDKLIIRQMSFGLGITGETTPRDRRPPTITDVTISLRKIAEDGFLSDEEEQFLYAILAVSRADKFGNATVEDLADKLAEPAKARAMWNAIPEALRLINVSKSNMLRSRWQLAINIGVLCKAFGTSEADRGMFEQAYDYQKKIDKDGKPIPICPKTSFNSIGFGFKGFQHPASALAFKADTPKESRYFDRKGVSGTFEFVDVEVRGVTMRKPRSPESKWSLKEWQEAGICKLESPSLERAVIRRLKLRGTPPVNWMTVIYGKPSEPLATHQVQITYLSNSQTRPGRSLTKLQSGYPYRINVDDLDKLRLNDIAEIEWGSEPSEGLWRAPKWSGAVTQQCELPRGGERDD